jgi:hypothetical protein
MTPARFVFTAAVASLSILSSLPAAAQTRDPRLTVSAIAGREHVEVDGGDGTFSIAGAAVRLRLTRFISVQGDLTAGSGEAADSYEGVFTTLGKQGDSIEELERLGVVLRRNRVWTPGTGLAVGVAVHTPSTQRVGLSASVGVSGRELALVDTHTLVRLPPGWPESMSTGAGQVRYSRKRGGPYASLAMPVNVTRQFFVLPEVRWVHTVADEDFTASSFTIGAGWKF